MRTHCVSMARRLLLMAMFTALGVGCSLRTSKPRSPHSDEPTSEMAGYVPQDARFVLAFRPTSLLKSSLLQPLWSDKIIMRAFEERGFDQLLQSELLVAWAEPAGGNGLVIRFGEPVSTQEGLEHASRFLANIGYTGEWIPTTYGGRSYRKHVASPKTGDLCLTMSDDRTLLIGSEASLRRMLDTDDSENTLAEQLLSTGNASDCMCVMDVAAMRTTMSRFAGEGELEEVLSRLTQMTVQVRLDGQEIVSIALQTRQGESTDEIHELLESAIGAVRQAIAAAAQANVWLRKELPDALLELGDALVDGVTFEDGEGLVRIYLRRTPTLDAKLKRAVSEMTVESVFRHMTNNARDLGWGLYRYIQENNALPPLGTPNGLSWRVHLLPHIGEADLYAQFHLNESWDSDHNISLLSKMPKILLAPGIEDLTKTPIMAFTGPQTVYPPDGPLVLRQIQNPMGTVFAVWAGAEKAVPWTKPSDIEFKVAAPHEALGSIPDYGTIMITCSGHAAAISKDWFEKRLDHFRRMITPAND